MQHQRFWSKLRLVDFGNFREEEDMACLCGDSHEDSVLSYDAFVYLLLRTASDNDDSFRTAFYADPESTLGRAGHAFRSQHLGSETLTLPSREDAQTLLADYLPDYDGTKLARMKVRFNWTLPDSAS